MKKFIRQKELITLAILNIVAMMLMVINSIYPESLAFYSFLLPVPFAIIYVLYDRITLIGSAIINVVFTVIITGNLILTLIAVFIAVILGIIIGKSVKKKTGVGVSLLKISIATIVLSVLTTIFYFSFVEKISLQEIYNTTKQLADNLLNELLKTQNAKVIVISTEDILVSIPTILIMSYAINSLINYFITIKIVSKLKNEKFYLKPFNEYYISNIIGAILIIIFCIGIMLDRFGYSIGSYISNSFYSILNVLLIINGLAFTYNFLINKFKYSKTISIITLIGSLFILTDVFTILGFIEMVVDFRRLDPRGIFKRK